MGTSPKQISVGIYIPNGWVNATSQHFEDHPTASSPGDCKSPKDWGILLILVGGLEHVLFVHMLGIIIPIDSID